MRLVEACAAAALAVGVALSAYGGERLWQVHSQNRQVAALVEGRDVAVDQDAPAPVQAARARLLIAQGKLDAAQAIADRLQAGPAAIRASVLYTLGNAHMRHALAILSQVPFRLVRPVLGQARSLYRQAIELDPGNWDARYNYALVNALIPDADAAQPTAGNQMSHERAAWPDIPGAPNGLP